MKQIISTIFLAIILAAPIAAHATDGVIEINQAKVMAAGGFPYVISQPGSYRLTSNLTTTDPNNDVIQVGVSNVTIDINGFTISGPVTCNNIPLTCSPAIGKGIGYSGTARNVKVNNGTVSGMGYGVYLNDGTVDNVTARNNSNTGIRFLRNSSVRNSAALENGADGIYLSYGGAVQSCLVLQNSGSGVWLEGNAVVSDSTIQWNGSFGIIGQATNNDAQAVISRNLIVRNGGAGIKWTAGPEEGITVSHNTIYKNGDAGIDVNSGTIIGNLIHWNTGVGLKVNYAASMKDNNFQGNNGGGAQTSGSVLYNGGGNMCGPVACP